MDRSALQRSAEQQQARIETLTEALQAMQKAQRLMGRGGVVRGGGIRGGGGGAGGNPGGGRRSSVGARDTQEEPGGRKTHEHTTKD